MLRSPELYKLKHTTVVTLKDVGWNTRLGPAGTGIQSMLSSLRRIDWHHTYL